MGYNFEQHDIEHIALIPLLFQTGYLTVKEVDPWTGDFKLDCPNKEVRESMFQFLIDDLSPHAGLRHTGRTMRDMQQAFARGDLPQVRTILNSILSDLPYEAFAQQSEGLYHGLIHLVFNYLGIYADSEVHSSKGRADAVVQTADAVYLFEFKLDQSAEAAVAQLQERDYIARYRSSGKRLIGIGVNFESKRREISDWLEVGL